MKILIIKLFLIYIVSSLVLTVSCTKDATFEKKKGQTPHKITQIKSEALSGKVKIFINTAQPDDYIYTRIDFQIRDGVNRSVKLSKYEDFIILEGFSKSGKHEVKLTPISKGEVEGESSLFEVESLIPPFKVVKNSLQPIFTFSGIRINFSNPESDPLSINIALLKKDENKIITKVRKQIKIEKGREFFLGLPSIEDTFYIYISDRWGNISDSLVLKGTPLKEIELEKSLFREFVIPNQGDAIRYGSNYAMNKLWDKTMGAAGGYSSYSSRSNVFNEINKTAAYFSINIGKKAKLSRFKMFHYNGNIGNYSFRYSTPKTFAIYGSNAPSNKENLDDWTLIQDFVSTKPANLSAAELTAYASINGEDFIFEEVPPAYQYYRFAIKSVWEGWTDFLIDELTFFGIYEN